MTEFVKGNNSPELYDNAFNPNQIGGKRPNMKHVPFNGADENTVIVDMTEFNGDLYVATKEGVYILDKEKDELNRIKFEQE